MITFACALTLMLACVSAAAAQSAPPPDPRPAYQQYRYDEDWSVLRGVQPRDPWDRIKYIPQGTAESIRHSAGVRVWGSAGRADYDEELIVQSGSFGGSPIRAYAVASDFGLVVSSAAARPRIGTRVFVTSGDRDARQPTLNTFDPLFPGIAYSGRAGLIGPTNLITLDPSVSFSLNRQLRVTTDWAAFWRTSTRDGIYGINVALLRPGHASAARFVGSQASVELDARVTAHLSMSGSFVFFDTGAFLRDTPPGLDTRYIAAHAAYRF